MVVFLVLFVLNKDCYGSRRSRSSLLRSIYSLLRSKYVLFWLLLCVCVCGGGGGEGARTDLMVQLKINHRLMDIVVIDRF
jgi:bacteriorhodopsin